MLYFEKFKYVPRQIRVCFKVRCLNSLKINNQYGRGTQKFKKTLYNSLAQKLRVNFIKSANFLSEVLQDYSVSFIQLTMSVNLLGCYSYFSAVACRWGGGGGGGLLTLPMNFKLGSMSEDLYEALLNCFTNPPPPTG